MEPVQPMQPTGPSPFVPCEGWWEQHWFGRQEMHELRLRFENGVVSGVGADVVGAFGLTGAMDPRQGVRLVKRYVNRHEVLYAGQYDGEGTLWGTYRVDGYTGPWMIRLRPPAASGAAAVTPGEPSP